MTALRWITGFRWDAGSKEIRFDITNDGKRVKCRVSADFLDERFGPLRNIEDFFSGAAAFRSEIEIAVKRQLDIRQLEADGSLLLRRFGYVPIA